jgi:hypothetical protein
MKRMMVDNNAGLPLLKIYIKPSFFSPLHLQLKFAPSV